MEKVIICIPSLEMGGAEKFVVDLASNVDKEKYKVIVAVTRYMTNSRLRMTLINRGIKIVDLSSKNYILMSLKQLLFFKKEKPKVVHANTGSVLHVMLACKLCHIPTKIYTVHNEAKLLYGESKFKRLLYKLAFSKFKFKPIAICPSVKKTLIDDMDIDPNNIAIVNNGVDTMCFVPRVYKKSDEIIRVISVGTLYWIKNQLMTVRVISAIHKLGYKIELTLLGDGEDRSKIKSEIEKDEAEEYIFLLGIKDNVEDYLKKSDIYISASRTEGLPLSILEAMACGLPIIATNAGGTKDIVHNKENGFIIEIDDEDGLKSALLKLIQNKDLQAKFSQESRRIAEEWSVSNCVQGYEKLYDSLV